MGLLKALPLAALAALAGVITAQAFLPAALILPVAVFAAERRWQAALAAVAFWLAASTSILATSPYLVASQIAVSSVLLWFGSGFLSAIPWCICWSRERPFVRCSAALIFAALPPFGLFAWAHPWHAAGLLFPGLAIASPAALTVFVGLLVSRNQVGTLAALGTALTLNLAVQHPLPPKEWIAVPTTDGDVGNNSNAAVLYERLSALGRESEKVFVLPEGIVSRWNETSEDFYAPPLAAVTQSASTVLIGTTMQLAGGGLSNLALVRGKETRAPVVQEVPVPVGMWRPWSFDSYSLSLFAPKTTVVRGQKAAVLICYEALLPWTYLRSSIESPTIMVSMANLYWVRSTNIPNYRRECLRSWSRAFNLPFLEANNQ